MMCLHSLLRPQFDWEPIDHRGRKCQFTIEIHIHTARERGRNWARGSMGSKMQKSLNQSEFALMEPKKKKITSVKDVTDCSVM